MKKSLRDEPSAPSVSKQEAFAGQALVIIVLAFVGANAALLLAMSQMAANVGHHHHPLSPPSNSLLAIFYFLGLLCLLGSALWMRFRVGRPSPLPYPDFQRQMFVGLALANLPQYLAFFWAVSGGAFSLTIPFFAGPAIITLLFILPPARKRAASLKQERSGSGF